MVEISNLDTILPDENDGGSSELLLDGTSSLTFLKRSSNEDWWVFTGSIHSGWGRGGVGSSGSTIISRTGSIADSVLDF